MENILNKVTESVDRSVAAIGSVIDNIQNGPGHHPSSSHSSSRGLGLMSSRSLPWWSSSSPGWREWSLLTAWTAVKITVNVNNQDVHNNNDLQVKMSDGRHPHILYKSEIIHRMYHLACWDYATSLPALTLVS